MIKDGTGERTLESGLLSGFIHLKSVYLGEGFTKIPLAGFSGCYDLESISLPDTVTEIGNGAFMQCKSLKNIVIPAGVTAFGQDTFTDCSSLESVYIHIGGATPADLDESLIKFYGKITAGNDAINVPAIAAVGETVTVSVDAVAASGKELKISEGTLTKTENANEYTFIMPEADITLTLVNAAPIVNPDPVPQPQPQPPFIIIPPMIQEEEPAEQPAETPVEKPAEEVALDENKTPEGTPDETKEAEKTDAPEALQITEFAEESGLAAVTVELKDDGTAVEKAIVADGKKVVVSGTVTKDDEEYQITVIAKNAFKDEANKKVTEVTLDENIKTLEAYAFNGIKTLKKLTIKGYEPGMFSKKTFKGVNTKKCTIRIEVPATMTKAERSALLAQVKEELKKSGSKYNGKVKIVRVK